MFVILAKGIANVREIFRDTAFLAILLTARGCFGLQSLSFSAKRFIGLTTLVLLLKNLSLAVTFFLLIFWFKIIGSGLMLFFLLYIGTVK
jgi:hypothetical protein